MAERASVRGHTRALAGERGGTRARRGRRRVSLRPSSDVRVHAGTLPWAPPFTLGHENAGWVHQLGDGVRRPEVGQPVAVVGAWGCGRCGRCRAGFETYCDRPDLAPVPGGGGGLGLDGGMAEFLLVPAARHLVPLPDGLDPVHAAPLTDAGLTPYHAVRRSREKLRSGGVDGRVVVVPNGV